MSRKYKLHASCGYEPGIHLIKLPKLHRQFVLIVPRSLALSDAGVPAFMFFHGTYQTPWFSINQLGLPDMLERYGWIAVLPFGKTIDSSESMGGVRQCCPETCANEACCLDAKEVSSSQERTASSRKDIAVTKRSRPK